LLACGVAPKDWGDESLRGRIAALRLEDVADASIALDECPKRPRPLSHETLSELLRQVSLLTPAPDIGMREEWKEWRIINLRTAAGETFEIDVSTRDSLGGRPIVVLEEEPSGGIGFYAGDAFWDWLSRVPDSIALESQQAAMPCS